VQVLSPSGTVSISSDQTTLVEGDEFSEAMITITHNGSSNSAVTVNITESPAGQLEVDLSENGNFVPIQQTLTIPAGTNSISVFVRPKMDSAHVAKNTQLTVSHPDFGSDSVTIQILPLDFAVWSGNRTRSAENIRNYAIGGGIFGQAPIQPAVTVEPTHFSLQAVVRTHDPKLSVTAESSTSLSNGSWQPVPAGNVSDTNLGDGTSLRTFFVPTASGETKKFLRLRINLQE
jgi:hypothetical protein